MENKLFEAAAEGSIYSLQNLLKDDPFILDRVHVLNCFSETPIHVAATLGHTDFVKEILRIKPELTTELDSNQSSPLHVAAAKGHLDVVKALLSIDHRPCLYRDRNGLTPLHLAALKGRIEVLRILLQAKPEAAQVTVYGGETIMHLCVQHHQIQPLKLLLKTISYPHFINSTDSTGNTVLHLAVADKQVETINFLLSVAELEVNAVNKNGMTAMDVLIRSRQDLRDPEIEESLKKAGAMVETANTPSLHTISSQNNTAIIKSSEMVVKQQKEEWVERTKSSLMIVASLTATIAFQVGVNPPNGLWQDTNTSLVDSEGKPDPHKAGYSILAHNHPRVYTRFYIVNTVGFIASLSIILLLMSGLPIRRRFFMWVLMVITWVAITALAITYSIALVVLTPSKEENSVWEVISYTMSVWIVLMALLLVGHTIRLFLKVFKKLSKALRRREIGSLPVVVNNVGHV